MSAVDVFTALGATLFVLGAWRTLLVVDPLRRLIALNVASVGVLMLLIAVATRSGDDPDPIPHALVLTGIVIMVSITGVALALIRRIEDDEATAGTDADDGGRP